VANERFQNALKRVPQAVPPIWFMRQAGRYHKHYQALRAKHSFMEMCKDADLAAEVAMGPIEDFDFDLAILFSDLLFPLEAMGMGLEYNPAPTLAWALDDSTIGQLRSPSEAIEGLRFQKAAMAATRKRLPANKSLIGFVGGPWTLFAYAVEGSHKGELSHAKKLIHLFKPFCEKLVPLLEQNIALQLEGGAEAVMVLDTAAGELSPAMLTEQVDSTIGKLARKFPGQLGYYAKGIQPSHLSHALFRERGILGGLGLDHRWDMSSALKSQPLGFLQGNFDQSLLFLSPKDFETRAREYLAPIRKLSLEERAGWVSGLGHGVLQHTPQENVRRMVQLIREVMA
jgi:uroporphyrinogen decarboxylase